MVRTELCWVYANIPCIDGWVNLIRINSRCWPKPGKISHNRLGRPCSRRRWFMKGVSERGQQAFAPRLTTDIRTVQLVCVIHNPYIYSDQCQSHVTCCCMKMRTHSIIPISKKCRLCKTIKLLNEFEINRKTRRTSMQQHVKNVSLRSSHLCCSCERCLDGEIMKSAFASMELLLSRIDNGLRLPGEMYMMIASLSYSTGVLCDNCERVGQ